MEPILEKYNFINTLQFLRELEIKFEELECKTEKTLLKLKQILPHEISPIELECDSCVEMPHYDLVEKFNNSINALDNIRFRIDQALENINEYIG